MPYILKDKDQNILSYSESSFPVDQAKGESLEYIDCSISEYSRRLELSHMGQCCATVRVNQSGPYVQIDVHSTLAVASVDLDVNGVVETVPLIEGSGKILLSTAYAGVFIIMPANRKTFCPAGKGTIVVEVLPNA